jgi:hypothetical protein
MLVAVTILSGAILGWEARQEGLLVTVPQAVAVAGALALAGYLRFLGKNWRGVLGRLVHQGSRGFQRESATMLAWSVVLHILVMGAVGTLAYWISALSH